MSLQSISRLRQSRSVQSGSGPMKETTPSSILRPILTFDAWGHAYYLDCQNCRAAHLKELWKIVDWKVVEEIAESKENQNILYYEAYT